MFDYNLHGNGDCVNRIVLTPVRLGVRSGIRNLSKKLGWTNREVSVILKIFVDRGNKLLSMPVIPVKHNEMNGLNGAEKR